MILRKLPPLRWLALLFFLLNTGITSAQSLSGTWYGKLQLPFGTELSLILHLTEEEKGWSGLLDSPDQNAFGIPLSEVTVTDTTLYFTQRDLSLTYKGSLNDEGKWEGTFEQNGLSLPLLWGRKESRHRPQTPQPPFPYTEEACTFESGKEERITLSGTLTLPPNTTTPPPVVLLLTGSGPQDRDETIMGHKPFALLADILSRNGFAVLRYDDRGVAQSTGKFDLATLDDLKEDALAAIRFLQKHPALNRDKIFLLGHSEGGAIASMIAAGNKEIAGIVLLAAPIQPLTELLAMQSRALGLLEGLPSSVLDENDRINRELFAIVVREGTTEEETQKALREYIDSYEKKHPTLTSLEKSTLEKAAFSLLQPGIRSLLSLRPLEYISQISCPVIALQGGKDMQVLPLNIDLLKEHCPQAQTQLFPQLNHLFQPAVTGSPKEYAQIETTIAPEALEWLLKELKKVALSQ